MANVFLKNKIIFTFVLFNIISLILKTCKHQFHKKTEMSEYILISVSEWPFC